MYAGNPGVSGIVANFGSDARDDLDLLHGAVDIHVHCSPDTYARAQDSIELARSARDSGLRAICIKTHNFSTGPLAILTSKVVPGIEVFGSIVLNRHVGGLNPVAVETAIKYGIRQLFLPTTDTPNMQRLTGHVGQHGVGLMVKGGISDYTKSLPGIELVDENGKLAPELSVIFEMVAAADIILNLGHVSFKEMRAVIEPAKQSGVKRIVVDHPFFSRLTLEQQKFLADSGAILNYTVGEIMPRWWRVSATDFANGIREIGTERIVVSSDCGQIHNPLPLEGLRIVCRLLLEEGFRREDIATMIQSNPAALLYP